jgi:hypothetical protein
MNPNRQNWNRQHQALTKALQAGDISTAQGIFRVHHAMLHTARMSGLDVWSFEDEILAELGESDFRYIPPGSEHSIAWNLWHIARIEDVTMNLLVAGTEQVYFSGAWFNRLGIDFQHSGNVMSADEISALSTSIDIKTLREYRVAVGQRTRKIVSELTEAQYKQRVDANRIQRVLDEGAVTEAALEIVDYWGKRTIAGLLLMPATRHNFVHLNECLRIKSKIQ